MTPKQLRQALKDLNGERTVEFVFADTLSGEGRLAKCEVARAMLIPDEADHLVKLTDGAHEYVIDAERVAWIRIGAPAQAGL